MTTLTYYVHGERAPAHLLDGPSAVRRPSGTQVRRRELFERIEYGWLPLPKTLAREWVEDPPGLVEAARIARELMSGPVPIRPVGQYRRNLGRFCCADAFVKVGLYEHQLAVGRESIYQRWASEKGWAPRITPTPGWTGALVSEWIGKPPPDFGDLVSLDNRRRVVDRLRELHQSRPLVPRDALLDPVALENVTLLRRRKYESRHALLCPVSELKARLGFLLERLKMRPADHVFCHFQPTPKHLRLLADRVLLTNWSKARYADCLRDLASFAVFTPLAGNDAHTLLCQYFFGPPSSDATRRFGLWLMALALDEHCRLVVRSRTSVRELQASVERLERLENLVPPMPQLNWQRPPTRLQRVLHAHL